ncbi:MAG: energy-coupled thiamine transporter ThiT [Erysipelotrichaceae bacterium]|nr:energy-coupled thiamine transporter ThiT [Erysipelotrichaceae bacterium]
MFKVKLDTRAVAYIALFVAMQIVLEALFKVIPGQPQGGAITLSLLPIFLGAYLMGPEYGLIIGLTSSLLMFVLGLAQYWGPWSLLLDYVLPVTVCGVAGFFPHIKAGKFEFPIGIVIAMILKYGSHVLSGAWLFAEYAPEGMNPWIYSLAYNFFYNFWTMVVTIIVFMLIYPRLKKAIIFIKK